MVKLTDIPDMNYYAKNGEGEVSIQITVENKPTNQTGIHLLQLGGIYLPAVDP